jgi:hypothetical protein
MALGPGYATGPTKGLVTYLGSLEGRTRRQR